MASKSLLWKDLSDKDVAALQGAKDATDTRKLLISILGFNQDPSPKEVLLLEFFLNNLRFAVESKLSVEKTSALFSILRNNHQEMVRGHFTLEQSIAYFKQLLLLHAVQRPPYSVGIFTFKDVTLITDYVNETYYANFKLFQYCFTESHELVLTSRSNLAEIPPTSFTPLADAIPAWVPEAAPEEAPPSDADRREAAAEESPAPELDLPDVPPQLREVIANKIQVEVRKLEAQMEAAHEEREARLHEKLALLESSAAKRPSSKGK